jgi:hypothetical protein
MLPAVLGVVGAIEGEKEECPIITEHKKYLKESH